MTRLLIVRHGETEWNTEGRIQGHTNSKLSALGVKQAQALTKRLGPWKLDAVYSSDLTRAMDTIAAAAKGHKLSAQPREALREKGFGEWEGQTVTEVSARYPDLWKRYHGERELDTPIPGGESWTQVKTRVLTVLQEILDTNPPDATIVIVGHGAALRPILLDAMQAPLTCLPRISLDNASLSIVEYKPPHGGRLQLLNDTSHLEDVKA
ncbi:alpha-ribazole phosphatase [Capsulimonas corticalis]|uniref:Alpha-ribazole phosphatase n=1 Tax=Capsulimonas corticalis TaxID=2219043 RepID=A0A402CYQ2_9BACT|nr:histidine phosphatase family protein [Capsulimonas corticalis]BDI31285.1 alpha-ribazole phosphatase [Capsulimonas corticalis]